MNIFDIGDDGVEFGDAYAMEVGRVVEGVH
jgi:hypothetical protein